MVERTTNYSSARSLANRMMLALAACALLIFMAIGLERHWTIERLDNQTKRQVEINLLAQKVSMQLQGIQSLLETARSEREGDWYTRYNSNLAQLSAWVDRTPKFLHAEASRAQLAGTRKALAGLLEEGQSALDRAQNRIVANAGNTATIATFAQGLVTEQERASADLRQSSLLSVGWIGALLALLSCFGFGWSRHRAKTLFHSQEHVFAIAMTDADTGLPNKHALLASIERLQNDGLQPKLFDVATVGMQEFTIFDEALGEGNSDQAIAQMAQELRRATRELGLRIHEGLIARTAESELSFAIDPLRHSHIGFPDIWDALLERLHNSVLQIGGVDFEVNPTIGFASFPEHGSSPSEILSNSILASRTDSRAYDDKDTGAVRYNDRLRAWAVEETQMRDELRQAIQNGLIEPHFQPVVDVGSRELLGVEALARWRRESGEFVRPDIFIEMAEELGMIADLTRSILNRSLQALSELPEHVWVAVNVSPALMQSREFISEIVETVGASGEAPHRLEIELTETAFLVDSDRALHAMNSLRAAGMSVALDDFGTGYSSLSYLGHFPIDKIKLDRSFLSEMAESGRGEIILQKLISLGNDLGMTVTAEGVETQEQAELLKSWRCMVAQGFLYSRPVPLETILFEWCSSQLEIDELVDLDF